MGAQWIVLVLRAPSPQQVRRLEFESVSETEAGSAESDADFRQAGSLSAVKRVSRTIISHKQKDRAKDKSHAEGGDLKGREVSHIVPCSVIHWNIPMLARGSGRVLIAQRRKRSDDLRAVIRAAR